jgi:uncharacterized protein
MTGSSLGLAIAALSLAAPSAPSTLEARPPGPSFDCAKARAIDEKLVCSTTDLSAMDRLVADAYSTALRHVPEKEGAELRAAQKKWLGSRAGCVAASDDGAPGREKITTCLRREYARRLSELVARAVPLPPSIEPRTIKWSDERGRVEADIAYPSLPGSAPGATAFTAWFERRAKKFEAEARALAVPPDDAEGRAAGGLPSSFEVSFSVPLATSRVLAVVFAGYQYPSGAAHGLPFQISTTFDLDRGRPLADADLFGPGGKRRAVDLVIARLKQQGYGTEAEPLPGNVREVAGELSNWTFRADAVEVTFPVYSVASYAEGSVPVWLVYEELRPFLRADAPLPPR